MATRRWVYALAAVLTVECVFSVSVVIAEAQAHGPGTTLAGLGLVCFGLGLVAAAALTGSLLTARRELDRRDQVIAAAAATTHDWVWETDVEDRITYSNQAVTELLGYQAEGLVGMSTFDLLADDEARATATMRREQSNVVSAGWDDVELEWRHRDGSVVSLQGSAAPLRDRRGNITGFRGTRRLVNDDPHPHQAANAARHRVTDVLASGALDIALQPIVSLISGETIGVEALARFRDGRSPDLWFRDAHDAGHTRELDELAFTAALPLLRMLPDPVYLSVNASPELLMDMSFRQRLVQSGLPLGRLVVEITEHARVADYAELNGALAPLREHGVRFAIDDTGAGYASLSHVLQLNPDIIKLDRALIANLDDDRARRSLVTALVLLALDVGASVTGEGVETATQQETLATLGVDQAQGYHLARPTTDPNVWQHWWTRNWTQHVPLQATPATDS